MPGDNHWPPMKISDLIRESRIKGSNGRSAKKLTIRLYGRGIVASSDRGGSEATNYFVRKAGQFAYSKLDCLNGAFGIIPSHLDGYETTLDLPTFDFVGDVDPSWFLKTVARPTFYGRFKFAATGSRKANRVPTDEFLATRLSLPPLAEQRAIADVLGAVEEAIAKTEALIEALIATKNEVLEDRLKIGAERANSSSNGWTMCRLRDVATIRTGISKSKERQFKKPLSVPYLRVANVQDGYLDLEEVKLITIEEGQIGRYSLQKGDVLFNEGGDFDKLGRGCVWDGQISPCVHQNHVFAVRCGPTLDPEFLALLAASRRGKVYFRLSSKQTTNLASINTSDLRTFPVLLPTMSEQMEIAAIAKTFDVRTTAEKEALATLVQNRNALAQELLSGRLRLPESIITQHLDKAGQAA
jgi:type I restriction enzyme, S subunit